MISCIPNSTDSPPENSFEFQINDIDLELNKFGKPKIPLFGETSPEFIIPPLIDLAREILGADGVVLLENSPRQSPPPNYSP